MIVERRTFKAKLGKLLDVADMAKAQRDKVGGSGRICTSFVGGAVNRVILEWEFENEAAREQFWEEWSARPETPAFMEKFNQLIENDGSSELLKVQ
jgi:hypothetical protein